MPPQGEGGGGFFSAVAGLVSNLFGFGSDTNTFFSTQLTNLTNSLNSFAQQVFSLFGFFKNLGLVLLRAVRHILDDVIHLRFLHLLQDIQALREKIQAWARRHPLLLRVLRSILHPTQTALIAQVLNTIQRLRQLLLIFRLFHLRFATELDRFLSRVEARVIRNTTSILRKVNEISSLLSLALNPFGIITRNPIFAVFTRALDSWFKLLTGHGLRDRVNRTAPAGAPGAKALPFEAVRSSMFAAAAGQPSDYGDIGAHAIAVFRDVEEEIGGKEAS